MHLPGFLHGRRTGRRRAGGLGPPVLSAPGLLGDGMDRPGLLPVLWPKSAGEGARQADGPGTCRGFPRQEARQPRTSRGLLPPCSTPDSPSPGALRSAQVPGETKRASGPSRAERSPCTAPASSSRSLILGLAVPGDCSSYHSLTTSRTMPFCPARHLKRSNRLPRGKWWPGSSRLREHQPRMIKPRRASGFWWLQAA